MTFFNIGCEEIIQLSRLCKRLRILRDRNHIPGNAVLRGGEGSKNLVETKAANAAANFD